MSSWWNFMHPLPLTRLSINEIESLIPSRLHYMKSKGSTVQSIYSVENTLRVVSRENFDKIPDTTLIFLKLLRFKKYFMAYDAKI